MAGVFYHYKFSLTGSKCLYNILFFIVCFSIRENPNEKLNSRSVFSDKVSSKPFSTLFQALFRVAQSCQETAKFAVLRHSLGKYRLGCINSIPPSMNHKGLENTTVEDVLMIKDGDKNGSWLWCRSDDTVLTAVKQMAQNNVGSLVVLKPGDTQLIAGIITERDYLRKIASEERPAKYTRVGDIMTDENKLITVASDTNILHAMRLMTENHIRHVPVIDGKIVGMISMVDIVRAVMEQQGGDVKRLNEFIKGEYY